MTSRNEAFVSAFVEALARSGVRHACICPGSRNTPLSLAFSAHPDVTDWSHHDERSASFFAIGLSVATSAPVVIVTTSGTAAAELHAAVVEAEASHVPLVVITADRPTELFEVSAPQTIDQRALFGRAVRWHHDLDVPDPADVPSRTVAALGARLVQESVSAPPGPVHLNVRFREPLVVEATFDGVAVPVLERSVAVPTEGAIDELAHAVAGRRGVIVAGPSRDPALPFAATALAAALGWPILSDPISGLRAGTHSVDHVVGSDLLAAAGALRGLPPEAVLRVGAPPTSKAIRMWLAEAAVPQAVIAPVGWPDPDSAATLAVRAEPAPTLIALADEVAPVDPGWITAWREVDRTAAGAASDGIAAARFPSEPAVAAALAGSTPDGGAVWTASSMPIRDVDSFFPVTARDVGLFGNRGANGIDGLASTALGTAADGRPAVAHLGDLSMLHDVGSLATAARLALPITFLVINNDGGGIFHFLPQHGHEHFERHFGTPHGLSFRDVAEGFGIEAVVIETSEDLATAIAETGSGPRLAEVRTDREQNLVLHRHIADAVSSAVGFG